jgi:hypothetical protein
MCAPTSGASRAQILSRGFVVLPPALRKLAPYSIHPRVRRQSLGNKQFLGGFKGAGVFKLKGIEEAIVFKGFDEPF